MEVRARPRRSLRLSKAQRRTQIADAALHIIAEEGLGRFTILAISREVGLTDGALFRHFPTKAAVVQAAIERVGEFLFEGFPPADPDPLSRLGLFFQARVTIVVSHPGLGRLLFSEELEHAGGTAGAARVLEYKRRSAGFIRDCLGEAEGHGQLAPAIAVHEGVILVVGALMALLYSNELMSDPERVPGEAERVWHTLERILRRQEP